MASSPYEILGDDGIKKLVDAFYDAMNELPQAAEVRAMHAENLDEVKRRLKAYLIGWMGGPPVYLAAFGTVCLTDVHKPYPIDAKMRDQWLLCMHEALQRIDASEELKEMLKDPLYRIADTVRNWGGPDGEDPAPQGMRLIARG